MKTLAVTAARQKLGYWLQRALEGEDIGIVINGEVVGLRPVEVISGDYALREYGVSAEQLDRAVRTCPARRQKSAPGRKNRPFRGPPAWSGLNCIPACSRRLENFPMAKDAPSNPPWMQLQTGFGKPHQHSGLGIRRLREDFFECRAGLDLRILFLAERGMLTAYDVMTHSEIQKFLRNF